MFYRVSIGIFSAKLGCWLLLFPSVHAQEFALNNVDSSLFQVTTFASDLNFPLGMAELSDGSLLVGVSQGSSFFGSTSGQILRLVDNDGDGIAEQRTVVANAVPGGGLSALRVEGDLVFTTGQGRGKPITIYRLGADPSEMLTQVGQLSINYPGGGWLHPHSALATRPTPGLSNGVDLFFQLGSKTNFDATSARALLSSDIGVSGILAGDAIHRVTIVTDEAAVAGQSLTQIATGLRNAAGMTFHPTTGDLYLQDNGIDGLTVAIEPHSADEINMIAFDQIGGAIEDFGFPHRYNEYRTGNIVGSGGIDPIVAFHPLPLPDGDEAEGPNDIVFAPPGFPTGLNTGLFVGMHGQFSRGGTGNEENPLVYADPETGDFFHFIGTDEASIGHLDGLVATRDSLFVADISSQGGFGTSGANSGVIYKISSSLPCDLNGDSVCDVADLDLLIYQGIASQDTRYDLDGNRIVDLNDRDAWLAAAGDHSQGSEFYAGDANLDGRVDAKDLNVVGIAWQRDDIVSWSDGDFNGDSVANSSDLAKIGGNWQVGVPRRAPVPEPTSLEILGLGIGFLTVIRRKIRV